MINPEGFIVRRLKDYNEILEEWQFLLEGLDELNRVATKKRWEVSAETFLQVLLDCLIYNYENSYVSIIKSKNGKNLAYLVAMDVKEKYNKDKKILWVYAIYSNKKSQTAASYGFSVMEEWAVQQGFDELQGKTVKTSGAFLRLMRNRYGMRLSEILFAKELK